MKQIALPLFFIVFFSLSGWSQDEGYSHCVEHDDHFHAQELGLSVAPVWFSGSDESGAKLGLHAHYIKRLNDSAFGLGLGVEFIVDEHKHQTYSVVGQWTPIPAWHFIVAPGVALEEEEGPFGDEREMGWAVHFEVVREFALGRLDIGPSFEYALDSHGQHIAVGVHVGIPFE